LFEKHGLYSSDLRIASDWKFFFEVILEKKCSYQHIPVTMSYFAMDGISCSSGSKNLPREEQLLILGNKFPRFIDDFNLLEKLEKEQSLWTSSNEYKAYNFLKKIGFIKVITVFYRIGRKTKRTFSK
jgi:hypothetical protein